MLISKYINNILDNIFNEDDYDLRKWQDIRKQAYQVLPENMRSDRNYWKQNINYWLKKQMPEFHIPIINQLKKTILYLVFILFDINSEENHNNNNVKILKLQFSNGKNIYNLFKMILYSHENREEFNLFPNIKMFYPNINIDKLEQDHNSIHNKIDYIDDLFLRINIDQCESNIYEIIQELVKLKYLLNNHFCYEEIIITCIAIDKPEAYNWNRSNL